MFGPGKGTATCLQCGKESQAHGTVAQGSIPVPVCEKEACPGRNRWKVGVPLADIQRDPMPAAKPTNPKDAVATDRVPLHLVSPIAKAYLAIAQYLGLVKYGAWNWRNGGARNWRNGGARASIYKAALERHMDAWFSGEEFDPVDGTPHLANAMACLQILIETKEAGNLVDDRPIPVDLRPAYKMVEALMPKIRERYDGRNPQHFTRDQQDAE